MKEENQFFCSSLFRFFLAFSSSKMATDASMEAQGKEKRMQRAEKCKKIRSGRELNPRLRRSVCHDGREENFFSFPAEVVFEWGSAH